MVNDLTTLDTWISVSKPTVSGEMRALVLNYFWFWPSKKQKNYKKYRITLKFIDYETVIIHGSAGWMFSSSPDRGADAKPRRAQGGENQSDHN